MEQTMIIVKDLYSVPENFTGIVKTKNRDIHWYKEGKFHREDGPAIEFVDGENHWYKEGKLHREDGPAVEYPDGTKEWWIDNIEYNKNYFNLLYRNSIYIRKEIGRYNLKWLKFLTENGFEEFPIIPGIESYFRFKQVLKKLLLEI
jgi:hypothetical protein